MDAKVRYLHCEVQYVKSILQEIILDGGKVFAINPEPVRPGDVPQRREIWFMSKATEAEIYARALVWHTCRAARRSNVNPLAAKTKKEGPFYED